jgi:glycosyltransferase involved in cell wall biosynthesis
MKVCILGSFSGLLDEGMANVSYYLYKSLKSRYRENIFLLNVRDAYTVHFWKDILKIRPNVIHYFPGPTVKGMLLFKIIHLLTNSKAVLSATKPLLPKWFKFIASVLGPDVTIVHSAKSESYFKSLNYETIFIPNGVDLDKFVPPLPEQKRLLRIKYGFACEDFIILHVGPVRKGRNQKALVKFSERATVLLIASTSNPSEDRSYSELQGNNRIILWKKYFPKIEEIYSLADVYAFPVFEDQNSIEIPLSVMEAMACNLPIVSSKYGALERIFSPGEGLFFVDNEDEMDEHIMSIRNQKVEINTRKVVEFLSWGAISAQVSCVYESLVGANSEGRDKG